MNKPATIDEYILSSGKWENSLALLRELMLSTDLVETIKWGIPVYSLNNKNVLGFSAFKNHIGIWFFQGVFLKDRAKKLTNAQEGVTKAQRQWRLNSYEEIEKEQELIIDYLEEAIRNQRDGKELKPDRNKPVEIPAELKQVFLDDPVIKVSFDALSLSKKRDFAEYISQAKRSETRESRLGKIVPMIRAGIGLYDKYKK